MIRNRIVCPTEVEITPNTIVVGNWPLTKKQDRWILPDEPTTKIEKIDLIELLENE